MPRGSWLFSQILFDVIIQDWRNLIVEFLHFLRNYIYCLHDGAEFSKINPSFFTIKKGFFLPLRLSCKESSTSNQAFLLRRKDVTALLGAQNRYALRLADHQRSTPDCAGWDRLDAMLPIPNLKPHLHESAKSKDKL